MAIVEIKNLSKNFKDNKVLNNINIDINEGEMVAITGVSGKGKSTILNIIGLLEDYDTGIVKIDGHSNVKPTSKEATKIRREIISYLFQNFALIEEETVLYNLNLALQYVKASKKEKAQLIKDTLDSVGLSGKEKNKVFQLSGGEQQRVALARIILKPCKIILADEPTGSLDKSNVNKVMDILKTLNKQGKTVILVTHDNNVANECNRIIEL